MNMTLPRLVDELVPGLAAEGENLIIEHKGPIGDPVVV